ncbi:MAG TPA: aryl-sulfate sulfotransferase [Candidatus Kapabacteria bacterium]
MRILQYLTSAFTAIAFLSSSACAQFFPSSNESAPLATRPPVPQWGDTLPPPAFRINDFGEPSDGMFFLANVDYNTFTYSSYILIVDNQGEIIQKKYVPAVVTDFKLHENGELSYFNTMSNEHIVVDSLFNFKRTIKASDGYKTDNHEIHLLKNGHVILLAKEDIIKDLTAVIPGGKQETKITGNVVQEFDENGVKVFEWRSNDFITIHDATHEPLDCDYIDLTHMNTIEIDHDNNLLLSSRNLDEITKVNKETGKIMWRFGGKNNQFTLIGDTVWFSRQHSIRVLPNGHYILFDNGNYNIPQVSRVCEYVIDTAAMTATLVWQYRRTPDIYAYAMGSVQYLPATDRFIIGWGTNTDAAISEVDREGRTHVELKMSGSNTSYRVFKFPWKTPTQSAVGKDAARKENITIFPNPASAQTSVIYSLATVSDATLTVEDNLGRTVKTVDLGVQQSGVHSFTLPVSAFARGVYSCKLQTSTGVKVSKLVVQ